MTLKEVLEPDVFFKDHLPDSLKCFVHVFKKKGYFYNLNTYSRSVEIFNVYVEGKPQGHQVVFGVYLIVSTPDLCLLPYFHFQWNI